MTLFSSAPKSLCILRLSAIGDVCNTVATVQAIQRQWPTTEIVWITGQLEAKLIEDLSGIKVVIFDKKKGWQGYKKLWAELKSYKFDALLHMQYAFRASIATLGIKAKYKLGFDAVRSQDFQSLFTNVKVPSPSSMHVLDGLLAFGKTLGVTDMSPSWKIDYSASDSAWAVSKLATDKRNLVLVPAASKAYKNWTAEGYAQTIQHAHQLGWNIILAGSPAQIELDLAKEIEELIDVPANNLVGKSSLKEMLALLDKADLVIAPDTGPAHMANAVNTPVIGLYAHHNPERTGPYQYRQYVVSAYEEAIQAETGKPSSELSWRARVKDKSAMQRIQPQQVIAMFDKVTTELDLH
ncbi:lipopolysaccharide heptosyltransferase family protein [Vibrio aquaticus]|uniref:Lipopolysaccharide heptosyltransferase family protein n=1 Tax=Vibrio aquaticus TaxID=2496559 RepID=A0A3S0P4Z4_9VIBR|nr:glycosyltransferase family 9 protein [Vibrio aquaticus]RTZ14637.1 lipopolysaccharide heptosyltransferase family protein [Vibrio aquaticus]